MSVFERATSIDDAIDEVRLLASSLPGDFAVDVEHYGDLTLIAVRGTLVSSGCGVEVDLHVVERAGGVTVPSYRIDVRRGGGLVWRADKHPGHESAPGMGGRPEHRHVPTDGAERRIPDKPQTLTSIQSDLVSTNLEIADADDHPAD